MHSPSDVSNHVAKVDGWGRAVQLAMEKLLEERNHPQMKIDENRMLIYALKSILFVINRNNVAPLQQRLHQQ